MIGLQPTMMTDKDTKSIKIFFKAGYDNECLGACYQSQRVLMFAELKAKAGVMPLFEKTPVNISKPPKAFKELGLHLRVPALYLDIRGQDFDAIDIADDIIVELDSRYQGGILKNELDTEAENATRNFFSKFCYWMRGVAKDTCQLETELKLVDAHLGSINELCPEAEWLFLCGDRPALLDCEVLPKLHQVRVAAEGVKGYEIPRSLTHLWRYLHSAYNEPSFVSSCPSDTEILLHWLDTDHPGTLKLSPRQQQLLKESSGKPPKYSFSVPATATKVLLE
ncbi:chloride intracellular channel exl-1-like [Macrosteles quadrilineatus]|uniref:chloride intracellular channel exl-1-like n=1 Tax=Macrosteles quadrilineatus TaxID=74068 RepID=UPI0023E22547|nr:chloride intracellular channel exl-1-like [Macrosteles quadrilineatus]